MNWQWGQLGLTESGGNRLIKYTDAIVKGVSAHRSQGHVLCSLTYTRVRRHLMMVGMEAVNRRPPLTPSSGYAVYSNQSEIFNIIT